MTCPECNQIFESSEGSCPHCGRMKGVVKTSTILISAGGTRQMYRSVEEVPGPLRKRLLRSTNGLNSATIVIADRQGRKEIAKAIRSLPASSAEESRAVAPPQGLRAAKLSPAVLRSAALILLVIAATVVWLVFHQ
jgi:hypothetical protein